jgi:hypothetical protein
MVRKSTAHTIVATVDISFPDARSHQLHANPEHGPCHKRAGVSPRPGTSSTKPHFVLKVCGFILNIQAMPPQQYHSE